ncbi:response regulator [Foetidibacter luteolus]|uniref:response regulator n=1 Tax=Foetidibacter luteolus TaxID=2608880 RepID=UPI00129BD9D0|nr:response regulator transcription factor [Foetidibacter luteolus]
MNFGVIDDHMLIAKLIKDQLERNYPDSVVKVYINAEAAIGDFEKWLPDIVISDILLPGMSGMDLVTTIRTKLPGTKFILLTSISDLSMVKLAVKKGTEAYLTKDCTETELLDAVKAVIRNEKYMNASLKERLLLQVFEDELPELHLSPRENEVLQHICKGKVPKEIAADMGLTINTVQQYIKGIMKKFKITRTTELVLFAIKKGLHNPTNS